MLILIKKKLFLLLALVSFPPSSSFFTSFFTSFFSLCLFPLFCLFFAISLSSCVSGKYIKKDGKIIFVPSTRGFVNASKREHLLTQNYKRNAEEKRLSALFNYSFLWPLPESRKLSSSFGLRDGKMHEGIDIPARAGAEIVSPLSGVVIFTGERFSGYGKMLIIAHKYEVFTVYAHLSQILVRPKQSVNRGTLLGRVGSSGRSTGPHLHFELRYDSLPLNPLSFVKP